jgi:hypothetical protein
LRGDRRKGEERCDHKQNASEFTVETRKRHLAVPHARHVPEHKSLL